MDECPAKTKLLYGICRCCLSKGYHKDMNIEYHWDGIREMYCEIFKDTFDITITNYKNISKLICGSCVEKLREANNFKVMVISSQHQFLDAVEDRETQFVNVMEETPNIKIEDIKEEIIYEVCDINDDYDCADNDSLDNEPLLSYPITATSLLSLMADDDCFTAKEREFLNRFDVASLKPLPKKSILPKAPPLNFKNQIEYFKDAAATKASDLASSSLDANNQVTEKNAHIMNVTTILQYSNAIPFKSKSFHGYPCFYCRYTFKNPSYLRDHVEQVHEKVDIRSVLWKYGAECLVVYVDVTDLKCKLCDTSVLCLSDLKKHLTSVHLKRICLEYTDRIVPFKLSMANVYECQVCGFNFETFGAIERHMNTHYRNYVCKECGGGFVTKYRLKTHAKNTHARGAGALPCAECRKEFASQQKLKNHIDAVHRMTKRFKCPHCKERFTEYFKRQKHLVQVHGAPPLEYKCNVCDKVFDRRYTLSRHLKKDHLEERDFQCHLCPYRCFTKTELQVHMIKHVGERIYDCKICKKSYARKKTLKEHMRIHNNDRRFTCSVCGQAFIQKCSLKGHVKTHHPELNGLQ